MAWNRAKQRFRWIERRAKGNVEAGLRTMARVRSPSHLKGIDSLDMPSGRSVVKNVHSFLFFRESPSCNCLSRTTETNHERWDPSAFQVQIRGLNEEGISTSAETRCDAEQAHSFASIPSDGFRQRLEWKPTRRWCSFRFPAIHSVSSIRPSCSQ